MASGDSLILGIESSCDETSAAVVRDGREVLSNIVASQYDLHEKFGGVVPEIASRAHIERIDPVINKALSEMGMSMADIDAVAVGHRPGLIVSLLVGVSAAKALAWATGKPLIGIDHVQAHLYAAALDDKPIDYPALGLVVSGGHTSLYELDGPTESQLLGRTIDDAIGEAYDKVAAILQLGFPGGPILDTAAQCGDASRLKFPRTLLGKDSLDFSFSGIKTAVLYHVRGVPGAVREGVEKGRGRLSAQDVADLAASFQAAVVDTLRIKLRRALRATGARTVILGGGVAANSALRAAVEELGRKHRLTVRLPALEYCIDNAAMTAGLAYHYLRAGRIDDLELAATATVRR